MVRSKVIQKGPKRTKWSTLVFLTIVHPFGHIGSLLDHFKPKMIFCSEAPQLKPYFAHLGKQIYFHLKWSKRVQMGPNRSQMVKNYSVRPFWSLLDYFRTLLSLPCMAIFGPKWTIFGPSPVMNVGPKSKKKAYHQVSYGWPAFRTLKHPISN